MDDGLNKQAQRYYIERWMDGVNAARADESGFPRLQEMANEIAARAGVKPPDVFVADFNKYSVDARTVCVVPPDAKNRRDNRMIVFDRVDANMCSEESLRATLGHEIAHMMQPKWLNQPVRKYARKAINFGENAVLGGLIATGAAGAAMADMNGAVTASALIFSPAILVPAAVVALGALAITTALASAWAYTRGVLWKKEYDADKTGAELTVGYASMIGWAEGQREDMVSDFDEREREDAMFWKDKRGHNHWTEKIREAIGIAGYDRIKSKAFMTHPSWSKRISYLEKLEKGEPPTDKGR